MSPLTDTRVLVAAGGTGGHITPALAVADELAARGAAVTFVTTPSQVERVSAQPRVLDESSTSKRTPPPEGKKLG